MRYSITKKGPVITILSQSQHASLQMQHFLQNMFQTKIVTSSSSSSSSSHQHNTNEKEDDNNDRLNQIFDPYFLKYKFNSSFSICESTNTILHFLSIDDDDDDDAKHQKHRSYNNDTGNTGNNSNGRNKMSIIAITPGPQSSSSLFMSSPFDKENERIIYKKYIQPTRNILHSYMTTTTTSMSEENYNNKNKNINTNTIFKSLKLAFIKYFNYKDITIQDLYDNNELPLIDFSMVTNNNNDDDNNHNKNNSNDNHDSNDDDKSPSTINNGSNNSQQKKFYLREVVIPFAENSLYSNGKTILQTFSDSYLIRPKVGLYQWKIEDNDVNSNCNDDDVISNQQKDIVFRPLPSASTDMTLAPPTFIYQCDSLQSAEKHVQEQQKEISKFINGQCVLSKVGFNGYQNNGQLRIEMNNNNIEYDRSHKNTSLINTSSLEFRFCDANELSSSFAEAQESLLAGSLHDLQNVNVMVEGTNNINHSSCIKSGVKGESSSSNDNNHSKHSNNTSRVDVMNGLGDCWVEFRANLKQPQGFWKQWNMKGNFSSIFNIGNETKTDKRKRIVKAPNIPYE